jgi:ATP-dependent Clp protease adaptor protein ClpS
MVIDNGFNLLKSKTMADKDTKILIRNEEKIKEPREYEVVLLNDNYTTQAFVVEILMAIFHKNPQEANSIMYNVHTTGQGVAGVYTWDIAQTKVNQVHSIAKQYEYPLKCFVADA